MTPSERERRIEMGGGHKNLPPYFDSRSCPQCRAERAVAEAPDLDEILGRVERAEAAARDMAEAARDVVKVWHDPPRVDSPTDLDSAIDELAIALGRHPSFSGEEGTEG